MSPSTQPPQLNASVSAFQRRFVVDVRRCEELEKTFSKLAPGRLPGGGAWSEGESQGCPGGRQRREVQTGPCSTRTGNLWERSLHCFFILSSSEDMRIHLRWRGERKNIDPLLSVGALTGDQTAAQALALTRN